MRNEFPGGKTHARMLEVEMSERLAASTMDRTKGG